jgi:transposase
MAEAATNSCADCQRLQAELAELRAAVARLEQQLAAARKDSSTSSKPPSSDIVKPPAPPPPAGQDKRQRGGQPGHPKHERALFPPEQLTHSETHTLHACPCCGGPLRPSGGLPRIVQQIDIQATPLHIEQHTCPDYWCARCQCSCTAPLPAHVHKGGLVGPRLTTLIAYLKGACHASYSTIRKFLRDVVRVTLSRSLLQKVIGKVSDALEAPYEELLKALPDQSPINVDETGHKDNGHLMWTWCFRAELYTLFKIDPHRSADVLMDVLGKEFAGVLGCDHFSAYRRYMRECGVVVQFCLAHLIRDVKFLTTLPSQQERAYGERLREALRTLFDVIHRSELLPAREFQRQLKVAREGVLLAGTSAVPAGQHAQTMAKRLATYGASYFTFVTTPGVEPTNNLAEQAIRFVVIDRLITQGTRSEAGQRWCERIWTVMATCAQQGRVVFDYLSEAVQRYFQGEAAPSLLSGR